MNPTVSVVTRTKNRPLLLARAIESVKSQTYSPIEHIIINDGGDPEPVREILMKVGHVDCIIIDNPESVGMEAASNLAIMRATGEYLVIHDDDDSWDQSFLEEMMAFIQSQPPELGVRGAVSLTNVVLEKLNETSVETISISEFNSGDGLLQVSRMAHVNQFPPISFVFSKKACEELGGFKPYLPVLGDWDFYLRFLSKFNIAILPKYLANYHQRPSSNGIYGNTIHAQRRVHMIYDTYLRNQYAREPEIIGEVASLLVNLRLNQDLNIDKKKKDLESLAKSCVAVIADRPKNILIFGASDYGIYCKDLLGEHVKVVGFLDNYYSSAGKVEGLPVFKPDVLKDMQSIPVLISTVGHRAVIIDQLKQILNDKALKIY